MLPDAITMIARIFKMPLGPLQNEKDALTK